MLQQQQTRTPIAIATARGAMYEHDTLRAPEPGSELAPRSLVRCTAHGAPSPQERWHYHDDYELHLIVATRGKAYIGDDISNFGPGSLVLIGPQVPHNFVSFDLPAQGVEVRSLTIQFKDESLRKATDLFPELHDAMQFLNRAGRGIEFLDVGEDVRRRIHRVRALSGLARFTEFAALLNELAKWPSCRSLSSIESREQVERRTTRDAAQHQQRIEKALAHIHEHCALGLSLESVSTHAGMTRSAFSRFFKLATGHTFTEFVTRVRITEACRLLREGRHAVSSICYLVGFNNVSNFNRHFRRIKGVTPSEFRNDTAYRRTVQ